MVSLFRKPKQNQLPLPDIDDSEATELQDISLQGYELEPQEVNLALSEKKAVNKRLDFLSLFVIGTGILGGLSIVLSLLTLTFVVQIANKPAPTLVELKSGRSANVTPMGSKDRTPEAITQFVNDTLVDTFDWRGLIPSSQSPNTTTIPDPGVDIGNGYRVSYSTWRSSYRYVDEWRPEFLRGIAELTPQSLFNQSEAQTQGVLLIREIGEPVKTAEGQWQVDVIANLNLYQGGDNLGQPIKFNKTITVAAINPPSFSDDPSQLQTVIYLARKDGLIVQHMRDLQIQ